MPDNLPRQLTSFIGREKEIAEVKRLLSTACLVTLTGTGGAGKTRLALQAGADLLDQYPDGVWFVELAPLSDPGLVAKAVASALDVPEQPGRPLHETLTRSLPGKHLLLVLDNCEHVLSACRCIAARLSPPAHSGDQPRGIRSGRGSDLPGAVAPTPRPPPPASSGNTWRIRGDPALRHAGRPEPAGVCLDRGQCRLYRADLPPTRWHPAGHRVRGGAGAGLGRGPDRRAAG